ncbi:putative GABA permease [Xylariomycetidae sp. FL2044]|nr:putative GABA permease [Xylariomycetidae sp. FL2044]
MSEFMIQGERRVSADEAVLQAQGHKAELRRSFSAISGLSLAFSITNSWIGYSASLAIPALAGGSSAIFFYLIVSTIANLIITMGMAELASAFPSSGGQYHFAFMLAPPKTRAAWAFFAGWLSVLGWALTATSATIITASAMTNIVSFASNGRYETTAWQIYLVFLGLQLAATAIPVLLPRALPRTEQFFFYSSLLCCLCGFVAMLAAADTKQSARGVFLDYENQLGWTDGFSFIIGLGQAMFTYLGTDAVTHVSEEVRDPGRHVPRIMCLTVVIGFATALPYILAMLFGSTNIAEVANFPVPIITSFYQATGSGVGTICYVSWMVVNYFGAAVGCVTTAGRLAWAFSRDLRLPKSHVFARPSTASSRWPYSPLNVSYAIPQLLVLIHGRQKVLPARYFDLGPVFGPFVNVFSCAWVTVFTVIFCFPYTKEVTPADMNYASVVLGGIILLVGGLWFSGKKHVFVGPNTDLELIEATHVNALSQIVTCETGNSTSKIEKQRMMLKV